MSRVNFMQSESDTSKLPGQQSESARLDPEVLKTVLDQAYNAVIVTESQMDPPAPRIISANPAFGL